VIIQALKKPSVPISGMAMCARSPAEAREPPEQAQANHHHSSNKAIISKSNSCRFVPECAENENQSWMEAPSIND
jgi:hypothetical protein